MLIKNIITAKLELLKKLFIVILIRSYLIFFNFDENFFSENKVLFPVKIKY